MTSRLGVIFDRVSQNTETKEITTPVRRKGSTFKSQCGTQKPKPTKLPKAWENASEQVAIGWSLNLIG